MSFLKRSHTELVIKILSLISVGNFVDRADASAHPGPSVVLAERGDGEGPVETVDDPAVRNLRSRALFLDNNNTIMQPSISSASMHDLLQLPAGQAVFEQIGVVVQGRLEEFGIRGIPTPSGRRYFQTSIQGTHKTLIRITDLQQ
jgi:hypothetical protein